MLRRILFLNHNYENYGTYFRCYYLGKYLSILGHNITLVCASKSNFDLRIRTKAINNNFRIITLPRLKIHEYHTGHILRMLINSEIVILKDFDILHSFAVAQPSTGIPTVLCRLLKGKPVVVDWDDDWSDGLGRYHPYPIWRAVSYLEKYIPKMADKITVASEFLKNKSLQYGYESKKIFKLPNGSNIDFIKPIDMSKARQYLGLKQEEPIILAMGHTYMESMDILLKTYSKIAEINPRIKLYIIGRIGLTINKIKEKYPALVGLVNFFGEQTYERIPYFLSCANVLVLPMEDSPMESSRFPIRLGDYLASGRPIVSNAVGEVKYVIESEGCGLTCKPSDIDNFAKNILALLENVAMQSKLGIRARIAAEQRFSWQKISAILSGIYDHLN